MAICGSSASRDRNCRKYAKGFKFIRQGRAQKAVKKISRLKCGVYRAGDIVRQSRSVGKNQRLPASEIRGRSGRRAFEREKAKICVLDAAVNGRGD